MSQKLEYKGITFDDFADERDDFRVPKYWSQICENCYKKYGYKMPHISSGGVGICGVEGCENVADYYIDFDNAEVKMTDVPFIRTITKTVAEEIIEFREPLGLFILQDDGRYVGIDNTTGDAWCEEFSSKYDCVKWLIGDDSKCQLTSKNPLLTGRSEGSLEEIKENALKTLNSLRAQKISIDPASYRLLQDAITGIETVATRDKQLESLWEQFADVPMNPDTECLEEEFIHFPEGTHREEVWHWFDERHSKGVAYLLYGGTAQTELDISTPIGSITVHKKDDNGYPGFWISLHRPEFNDDLTLALVEYSTSEYELATRVWGKSWQEDYTAKITHEGIEDFFRKEN